MKRDFDLIRSILLQIEAAPAGTFPQSFTMPEGVSPQNLVEHLQLMIEQGLIEGEVYSVSECSFDIQKLTWAGHDFLDAARNDTVWNSAKEKLISVGGSASLEILKALLVQTAKQLLGLPP